MEQLPQSSDLLQEYLKGLFEYREGELYWKVTRSNRIKPGDKAGYDHTIKGVKYYRDISIDNKGYRIHRIIWIMHFGKIPEDVEIDHKDGIKYNNKIENLRLATRSQNIINRPELTKLNTSGFKGISFRKGKTINPWRARVYKNYKMIWSGCYQTAELAHEAYKQALIKHYGEFARY